jgi:glycosyltransferase involved in cell wall biosynthesis
MKEAGRRALHLIGGVPAIAAYVVVVVPWSRLRARAKRRRCERPAILWGPIPILNIRYSSLAERRLGYRSDTLVYDVYRINARSQFDYVLDRWRRIPIVRTLVPYAAFVWAGLRYDVFGFFFDGGLLWATPFWRVELALLKLAGKIIVVYPYGSDARLASTTRALGRWHAYTDVEPGDEDRNETAVRERLAAFGRHADLMLGCNDLVDDLPRVDGILPYPFPSEDWAPVPERDDGVVTIVHPSNHRHYKGTRYLEQAVAELQAEGLAVELVLVEGMPLEEARRIYERADVIATDFVIGGYALAAIEGMALGKPVVAYLPERLRKVHPEWSEAPIVDASPDTLTEALRTLVQDAGLRRELGARGPGYVERVHGLAAVGAFMDAHYERLWRRAAR